MHLLIDGEQRWLTPLKAFRAAHHLPETFCLEAFSPKNWAGLGSLESAGGMLNDLRADLLAHLPPTIMLPAWLSLLPDYVQHFERGLRAINPQVGLREPEIEFAAAGFSDVLNAHAIALMRASRAGFTPGLFRDAYNQWLMDSIRLFAEVHHVEQAGAVWQVQVISHAYGRVGLRVRLPDSVEYVYDPALACPAEGFMFSLLESIAAQVETVIKRDI
jgi:hypothetical protein